MPLQNNSTKELVVISIFIAMSLVLSYVENFIPVKLIFAFPGIKIGLANIITLLSFELIRTRKIYLMVIIRIVMASIFIGSAMSFWYSLSGGLLSLTIMVILFTYFRTFISIISISAIGGIFHNIGQLIVLAVVTQNIKIAFFMTPKLLIAGLVTGIFIGYISLYIKPVINKNLDSY